MIEYLVGKKEDFLEFIDSINSEDKVGLITHTDLDGIASAIIVEEILKSKGLKAEEILFINYSKGMFIEPTKTFFEKGITKVIITDIAADSSDFEGFLEFRDKFDSFLVDHHPIDPRTKELNKVIKTVSADCATWTLFDFAKEFFDISPLDDLMSATIVSEWSFKKEGALKFLTDRYPGITPDTLFDFSCGDLSKKVGAGLIYYANDLPLVYSIVKKGEFSKLEEIDKLLSKEIAALVEEYKENSEYNPKKDIYFYYSTPKYNITSVATTILSRSKGIFVFAMDIENDMIKVSARNNTTEADVGELMKKGIEGLENGNGGGHKRAAAARFMKKDLEIFKERMLK